MNNDKTTKPVLSICIPTYNRARYLRCLLEHCVLHINELNYSYEIVISDNASPDDTESVVAEFKDKLPIRYLKREKNYGGYNNLQLLRNEAWGEFQVYLADDDYLIFPEINAILEQMLANPSVGIVFAPWLLHDRVGGKTLGKFYTMENDIIIEKGDYASLLSLILKNSVFPEHYVMRSNLAPVVSLMAHPLAYYAFLWAAEYCSYTRVWFRKESFYISVTRYFEDEKGRGQMGHTEAEERWDCCRGGLEYILSRIFTAMPDKITIEVYQSYLMQIQKFVADRLHVAIRLRIHNKRDPVDSYYLACRLRAMGFPNLIPIPFEEICYQAAAHYIISNALACDKIDKIICVGNTPERFIATLIALSKLQVQHVNNFNPENHTHAIILLPIGILDRAPHNSIPADRHLRIIGLNDVLQKFS